MSSINKKGFLSDDIHHWIEKHRKHYNDWFSLSENVSSISQKFLLSLKPPSDDGQKVISTILFSRILSHFQGIVLLTERGMATEARSLLRGMLDATFACVALSKHKSLVEEFVNDDLWQRLKSINNFRALPKAIKKKHRIGNAKLKKLAEDLQQEIDEKQIKPLTTEYLAQKAEMLSHYNTLFVLLSSSTHSRVRDLEQHLGDEKIDKLNTLLWGPDVSGLNEILFPACELLFIAAKGISNLFNGSEFDKEFQEQWEKYEKLIGNSA
jgi:hypothetical protein